MSQHSLSDDRNGLHEAQFDTLNTTHIIIHTNEIKPIRTTGDWTLVSFVHENQTRYAKDYRPKSKRCRPGELHILSIEAQLAGQSRQHTFFEIH